MNQATIDFVHQHRDDDVRKLAFLAGKYPEVDMPFALDQIRGRQMARTKLPRWAATEGLVYPPHISMEQCSSEATARYKAELAKRLVGEGSLVDLTGGLGVDFSYMAAVLQGEATYVERQTHLCKAAEANFALLGLSKARVVNGDGVEVLHGLRRANILFVDPARRDDAGNKVVSLADCTPDVTLLQDELLGKADYVLIKLSPMLDWHKAVADLKGVREVHIVSVGNECKELLLVLSAESAESPLKVYCVNDDSVFVVEENGEFGEAKYSFPTGKPMFPDEGNTVFRYLYEPNASLMKAGCFGTVCERFGMVMLARNSHLFFSQEKVDDFPGRRFDVQAISTLNKKKMKCSLQGITQANIAVRNFPLSVAELRKRLKLKDGGGVYIFASTSEDGEHILFFCRKI